MFHFIHQWKASHFDEWGLEESVIWIDLWVGMDFLHGRPHVKAGVAWTYVEVHMKCWCSGYLQRLSTWMVVPHLCCKNNQDTQRFKASLVFQLGSQIHCIFKEGYLREGGWLQEVAISITFPFQSKAFADSSRYITLFSCQEGAWSQASVCCWSHRIHCPQNLQ